MHFNRMLDVLKPKAWATLIILILCTPKVIAVPVLFNLLDNASVGVDWIASNTSRVVINSLEELNLRNGYVEVESRSFDFSEADSVDISFDVYVPFSLGFGLIGTAPNPGEDLVVQYRRSNGGWQTLTTFVADNGFLGLLSIGDNYNYTASLPANAYHDNFQLRYVMTGGGVNFFDLLGDNWYVSDIEITADLPPAGPDHFRLSYVSDALTCKPQNVDILACADSTCSSVYTDDVNITLVPSGWVGGDSRSLSGGSGSFELRQTVTGTAVVGVSSSSPAKVGGSNLCSVDGGTASISCNLTFSDSGFLLNIPDRTNINRECRTCERKHWTVFIRLVTDISWINTQTHRARYKAGLSIQDQSSISTTSGITGKQCFLPGVVVVKGRQRGGAGSIKGKREACWAYR